MRPGPLGSPPVGEPPDSTSAWTALLERVIDNPAALAPSIALAVVGIPAVLMLSRWVERWVSHNSSPQRGLVIGRLLTYAGLLGLAVTILSQLGFHLTPLLGAAGILGIALGFAAQTSVSNLISGFFIMGEQSFEVGDIIEVGGRSGTVQSIDMLSVKLRTFDNRFVRIPNETLIKSEVVTATRFPVRRIDVRLGVAYKEDLERVRDVLFEVARANPGVLMEPEPVFIFQGYGESSLDILFGVWATREKWLTVKTSIHLDIKRALDDAGIEIPFPHRTLYTGADSLPFPVTLREPGARNPGEPRFGEGGDPVVDSAHE